MQQPPLLPEETLARVLRLARFDGLSVFLLSTLFAVMAAGNGEARFAVIGLLAAGAGALELHGVALLRHGESRGMRWLIASQPFLLAIIYAYCALRLSHVEIPQLPESSQERLKAQLETLQMTQEEFFRMVNRLTAQIVAVVATVYQGWLMIYYLRRRRAVAQAVEVPAEV
ncbi:MAG: hypothetical protein V4773_11130 [Verrucomicrobiota bacterium]